MPWVETASETFVARHEADDADDARRVLAQLEHARLRLEERFEVRLGELEVVLHGSGAQLALAQPVVILRRALTDPAARRYVAGWPGRHALHVLAPRVLARRASNVEGSLEALMLTPSELLARRTVRELRRRPAWLVAGAAQYFSGQVRHVRPAVVRRLHEGRPPDFPPSRRDVPLLAGTIFDVVAREAGEAACAALVRDGPRAVRLGRYETAWRARLALSPAAGRSPR